MAETRAYTKIGYWVETYGKAGIPDQRAVHDFMECETSEAVRSLQNELVGLSGGGTNTDILDRLIGIKRKQLHGTYENWAKLMLMWISGYKG